MKTKELIKMLKDADPSGELHVRMDGSIPLYAYRIPGYYDGAYAYIDENGNYTLSTEGDKVEIDSLDVYSFVDDNMDENTKWEDIEKKFKFKLTYFYKEHRDQKSNVILKKAKEAFDEIKKYEKL